MIEIEREGILRLQWCHHFDESGAGQRLDLLGLVRMSCNPTFQHQTDCGRALKGGAYQYSYRKAGVLLGIF